MKQTDNMNFYDCCLMSPMNVASQAIEGFTSRVMDYNH